MLHGSIQMDEYASQTKPIDFKKSKSNEMPSKKLKKILPTPPLSEILLLWKCSFCTFVNYIDPLKPKNRCKICETLQTPKKDIPLYKEFNDIDFDVPDEFALNITQCPTCGYKFSADNKELCQCGLNLSDLNDFLTKNSEDEIVEPEDSGKLGIELMEVNGVKGGAITVRFWYPTAKKILFLGDFNNFGSEADFNPKKYKMKKNASGVFSLTLEAKPKNSFIGQRFKYFVEKANGTAEWRNDPRSVMLLGKKYINDLIYDQNSFQWTDQNHKVPNFNSLIIYEAYIQALAGNEIEGAFLNSINKLNYLKRLGVNAVELIPITQDAHEKCCWGYDPISLFAVHHTFGSANDLKIFINEAHKRGISVIIDWVPNHICKMSVLHEGYFYNKKDERFQTRYGPRPDYANPQVKTYLLDSLRCWLQDFHFDGVRVDSVESMRFITDSQKRIVEAWTFLQEMTAYVHKEFPDKILIAEDLQNDFRVNGLMGFDSQWDCSFFCVMLNAAKAFDDINRNPYEIAMALKNRYEASGFGRVIYVESHDTVPEDRQQRIIKSVNPDNKVPDLLAKRRARLVGAVTFVALGIPMLLNGQELMESRGGIWPEIAPMPKFDDLEDLSEEVKNSFKFFSNLIRLRLNVSGCTQGLRGSNIAIIHIHPSSNIPIIAIHRWDKGGPKDDVVVLMNFSNTSFKKEGYYIHFPRGGIWTVRLCSEGGGYGFLEKPKGTKFQVNVNTVFDENKNDGYMFAGRIQLKKYCMLILSQD